MSLKSFDKFCETLITAEPGSKKIILDERQRQVSSKLTTEALLIYIIASTANTVVMDKLYRWCDSFFAPMVLFMTICYIYWMLRSYFSGTLFGINGASPAKWTAGIFMVEALMYCMLFFSGLEEEFGAFHDGMMSSRLVVLTAFVLFFIGAAAAFVLAKKAEKAELTDEEKKG